MKRGLFVVGLWLVFSLSLHAQRENVGACLMKDGKMVGLNMEERFPMHSVMKFPQALYVASEMVRRRLPLEMEVLIKKSTLMQDTWSPMLQEMGEERRFSYAELLSLSLQQSDNNACDVLFRLFGKPRRVEQYLRRLGFHDIHVRRTERQMHDCPAKSDDNWCTPTEMARLLEWFYQHHDDNEPLRFVWQQMVTCRTGENRVLAALPSGAAFAHKTGTGYPLPSDNPSLPPRPSAISDVGMILLPDGQHLSITVFIQNPVSESRIAEVARQILKSGNEVP